MGQDVGFAVTVADLAEEGQRTLVARDRLLMVAEVVVGMAEAVPGGGLVWRMADLPAQAQRAAAEGDLTALRSDLVAFLDATRAVLKRRIVLATFLPPESGPSPDHAEYGPRFWSILQFLHDRDDRAWPAEIPAWPPHSLWEFSFHGVPMFVFAAAPTHTDRRSRNLGGGLVLLFQPRDVFDGIKGGTLAGTQARKTIRRRLASWDTAGPHPSMGEYGDPSNHEWTQYYIADDDTSMYASCPLRLHGEARRTREPELCLPHVVERQARRPRTRSRSSPAMSPSTTARWTGWPTGWHSDWSPRVCARRTGSG